MRLLWIDLLRGFCMLAILLFHTEIYYTGDTIIPYSLYVVNALTTFYCISGYLMYREESFSIIHKLKSIVRSLFIPYFIFTSFMALPKVIIHQLDFNIIQIIGNILSGNVSWFIATLIVAELLFIGIIYISKSRSVPIFTISCIFFLFSVFLSKTDIYNFWHFKNGLMAVLYLCLGYLYHKYEKYFQNYKLATFVGSFILIIIIKGYVFSNQILLGLDTFNITSYFIFMIDTVVFTICLFSIAPFIPHISFVEWIGQHCIVFYFLCGGIPMLTSMAINYAGFTYHSNYMYVLLVYLLVVLITTIATLLIYKYIPFITGKSFKTMQRVFISVCLPLLISIPAHAQLHLNGKKIAYDSLTNTYLATIPQHLFGHDYTCKIEENNNTEYTFHDIQADKKYTIRINDNILNISFTYLPVIELEGNFGYDYNEGNVVYNNPDSTTIKILAANLKWRGASTNTEDKHKRNYKIKFNDDQCFFNLRSDNNWILDAGQADVFRLRNHIATEIWNSFATKPYYAEQEPKALSGVRGRVVEVFLNNKYQGIYTFTENMDRKQMKLKKIDSKTRKLRGLLWKSKGYGALMNENPDFDNTQETWNTFEAKYPDLSDNDTVDWKPLHDAFQMVIESSDETFCQQANLMFDIPVFLDYYIFINVLGAVDNVGKNMYWAIYDVTKSKKITTAVWDLDGTVGQRWLEQYAEIFSSPCYDMTSTIKLIDRLVELNTDNFNTKLKQRYKELRNSLLTEEKLQHLYIYHLQLLKNSGAAKRETERWSGDTDIRNEIIDFDAETEYICQWITKRLEFLDQQWNYQTSISNPINEKETTGHSMYSIQGIKVSEKDIKKGIYIRNGKKIIVR